MQAVTGKRLGPKTLLKQGPNSPSAVEVFSGSSSEADEIAKHSFDFQFIKSFIMAVKQAIELEQDSHPPEKVRRYFPNLRKERASFPLLTKMWELIEEEWERPKKKG